MLLKLAISDCLTIVSLAGRAFVHLALNFFDCDMLTFSPVDAESLIEQHRQELYNFLLRRVTCRDTANDLLQDLVLRLLTVKSPGPIENPRAFLYRITVNLATDHLRSPQIQRFVSQRIRCRLESVD